MKKIWYPVLLLGLIITLVISNIGCPTYFTQEDLDAASNDGYASGYSAGEVDGYDAGETDGYAGGHEDGFDAGRIVGDGEGYTRGYAKGYSEGFQAGLQQFEEPTQVLFIRITSLPPTDAGNYVTLRAVTLPNALCTITVNYASGPSGAQGLQDKVADSLGNVSWTWLVGGATTPGPWPCVVTASLDGQFAQDQEDIVVT